MLNLRVCLMSGQTLAPDFHFHSEETASSLKDRISAQCDQRSPFTLLLNSQKLRPQDTLEHIPNGSQLMLLRLSADALVGPQGAAALGHLDTVVSLLEDGVDINARDGVRLRTALMWAAAEGRSGVVRALLAFGADPTLQAFQCTARGIAEANDHPEIAKMIAR